MSKRKAYSEGFHASLSYLIEHDYTYRIIGAYLGIDCAAVLRWHKKGRLPQSERMIFAVIGWAEYRRRSMEFFQNIIDKVDESEASEGHNIRTVIRKLKDSHRTYEGVATNLAESLEASIETRTLSNWDKGKKPKPKKRSFYPLKPSFKIMMPNEIATKILGSVAKETGLQDRAYYSLYPIFASMLDLVTDEDLKRQIELMKPEYEARKARSEV